MSKSLLGSSPFDTIRSTETFKETCMLTIYGRPTPSGQRAFCDRVGRRDFLKIGGMVMGGLSLSQLLAVEARAGVGRSHKAIINVFLPGGPPHQDFWDVKVDAPAEVRGPFQPISTKVPGIEICEMFPKIAAIMDKCVAIRSVVGATGEIGRAHV